VPVLLASALRWRAVMSALVSWWGMPGTRLPMFPLSAVLFPHASMPLHVFEPRYQDLMRDCLADDARFGIVLIARGSEVGGGDERSTLGTRGVITQAAELPDGRWVLEIEGEAVIEVEEWLPDDPYPVALVREASAVPLPGDAVPLVGAAGQRVRRARALLAEQGGARPLPPELALDGGGDAERASWELCAAAPLSAYDAQRLLAADGAPARLRLLADLMDELELDLHRMLRAE
jgi:Lon protease-like protein